MEIYFKFIFGEINTKSLFMKKKKNHQDSYSLASHAICRLGIISLAFH